MENPLSHFATLTDPRVERTREHLLEDVLLITIAAVLCGADTWNDIESYGETKQPWLETFLKLPGGIPRHDTFNRIFSALDPEELERCFVAWVSCVAQLSAGEVVSIDGKALRGSRQSGKKAIVHMVSAWASENRLVLGQRKVDDKSNEITAIPKLLEVLAVQGCVITVDAMGCQKNIATKVREKQADYILAVKENQGKLLAGIRDSFRFLPAASASQQVDAGHGRVETRTCTVINDLSMIEKAQEWAGLRSLVRLEAERYIKTTGQTEREIRYYISSSSSDAESMNRAVRQHWGIENSLHWVLDVAFSEDHSRKRAGHAAQNFSLITRIALNLLKRDTLKRSIKGKRLKAGWDNAYLSSILQKMEPI
jgi:predicted transposase YbfD/YdcC